VDPALEVDAEDVDETAVAGGDLAAEHYDRKADERRIVHDHVFEASLEVKGARLEPLRPGRRHLPHGHLDRHADAR
jgi:hypothetical protein